MATTKKVWSVVRSFETKEGKIIKLNPILFSSKHKAFANVELMTGINDEVFVSEECISKEFNMFWITVKNDKGTYLTHEITQEDVF